MTEPGESSRSPFGPLHEAKPRDIARLASATVTAGSLAWLGTRFGLWGLTNINKVDAQLMATAAAGSAGVALSSRRIPIPFAHRSIPLEGWGRRTAQSAVLATAVAAELALSGVGIPFYGGEDTDSGAQGTGSGTEITVPQTEVTQPVNPTPSQETVTVTVAPTGTEAAPAPTLPPGQCIVNGIEFSTIPSGEPNQEVIDAVKVLQSFLNESGFDAGDVDGLAGPQTGSAVDRLQQAEINQQTQGWELVRVEDPWNAATCAGTPFWVVQQ